MTPQNYQALASFLLSKSGMNLGPGKDYLVESRLSSIAELHGFSNLDDLVKHLQGFPSKEITTQVVEAMTTNETLFFRDNTPFDEMCQLMLPRLIEERQRDKHLRIWCAACSTGQEPYSIAMGLRERVPQLSSDWKIDIVATDINETIIERAKSGLYSQFEVQRGLPIQYLVKYFEKVEDKWQVKSELRDQMHWKQINLINDFKHLGNFDIIFCRNVLIYFDTDLKGNILDRMAKMTKQNGYLILGGAETALGISQQFVRNKDFRAAVYQPSTADQPSLTSPFAKV